MIYLIVMIAADGSNTRAIAGKALKIAAPICIYTKSLERRHKAQHHRSNSNQDLVKYVERKLKDDCSCVTPVA